MFIKKNENFISFFIRVFNSIGIFIIIPLLSIWLVDAKGMDIGKASIIVAAFTFMSKAGSAFVGGFINKFGIRPSLLIGLFGASIVLFLITYIDSYFFILLSVVLLGVFISLYNIALKTHISTYKESSRLNAYALLNIAVNVGSSIGPLIGGIVLDWSPQHLLLISMGNYLIAGLIAVGLPKINLKTEGNLSIYEFLKYRRESGFKQFVKFSLFSSLFWFLYTQIFTTLPVVLSEMFTGLAIGALFTVNAFTVMIVQAFFPKIHHLTDNENWYFVSLFLICLSFIVLWLNPTITFVMFAIVIFSISEVIWVPIIDSEIVNNKGSLSSSWAFGIAGVIWGIGESLGSFVGLNLYNYFNNNTFLILTIIALLVLFVYSINIKVVSKIKKIRV